jgi:hypothetical protein
MDPSSLFDATIEQEIHSCPSHLGILSPRLTGSGDVVSLRTRARIVEWSSAVPARGKVKGSQKPFSVMLEQRNPSTWEEIE